MKKLHWWCCFQNCKTCSWETLTVHVLLCKTKNMQFSGLCNQCVSSSKIKFVNTLYKDRVYREAQVPDMGIYNRCSCFSRYISQVIPDVDHFYYQNVIFLGWKYSKTCLTKKSIACNICLYSSSSGETGV